jgi:hypothetical protein
MKLDHLEATKQIFKLSNEEKGEWVDALINKESWINRGGGGDGGGDGGGRNDEGKEGENDDDEEDEYNLNSKTPSYLIEAYKTARENGLMSQLSPPSCSLIGLLPNTRYHFRLRAKDCDRQTGLFICFYLITFSYNHIFIV